MEAFFVSLAVVAVGEMGDKTQLLALMLSARFRRPLPIILGICAATLFNHGAAGAVGQWIAQFLSPEHLRIGLGISFLAVALWVLKPDACEENSTSLGNYGVFWVTFVAFFLAEMGDKTQVATIMLAAKYNALTAVVLGTTAGMMAANVPVVFVGDKLSEKIPFQAVRIVAASIFALLGVATLFGFRFGW